MPPRQKAFAILLSLGLIIFIFELVRRRKLREEYSWVWMLTGVIIFILAIWHRLLVFIARLIGAALPASAILFLGVFFLILICLYFSVKISRLTNQIKEIAQRLALLDNYVEEHYRKKPGNKKDKG